MKDIRNCYCFFEQSGTFKNEFIKLGIKSYDYDLKNDFNQTDFILDLFSEIDNAYNGNESIFDSFTSEDLIFAFFPCTRFERQIGLSFRGVGSTIFDYSLQRKLQYDLLLHNELSNFYRIITELVLVCIDRGLRLIIENPYSTDHYLVKYWAFKSSIIDFDRSLSGDFFVKPTQFWFLNCEPVCNFVCEPLCYKELKKVCNCSNQVERSLISSDYARRFILTNILECDYEKK